MSEIPNHFERSLLTETKQRYLSVSTIMEQPGVENVYITQIIANKKNTKSALSIQRNTFVQPQKTLFPSLPFGTTIP
jgi:hypothetical protein